MGKLYDSLQRQLKSEEYKKDAEDCIKIYEKLKEMNGGSVWSSEWQKLTTIGGWIGQRPNAEMAYKPSEIGYVFLKGIEEKPKEMDERHYPIQMAIMSHLSDCQEMLSLSDNRDYAIKKINFVKQLVLTYTDTTINLTEEELSQIWNKTMNL